MFQVPFEALQADSLQRRRYSRLQLARGLWWLCSLQFLQDFPDRGPWKGDLSGQELVENGAEPIDIGSDGSKSRRLGYLFRRQVVNGPDEEARAHGRTGTR